MYRIRKRALSIVLLVAMILTLMPVSAAAEENGTEQAAPHILSTIRHEVDDDGTETGQITAQIEAYLTDSANKTRTVKPCDIIFLIEQSTFMNTQSNTTLYGQERADILNTMEKMLDAIPAPTTSGEHRVAISGYGRINNPGNSDTYVADQYPGNKLNSSMNQSLNTGYYTCKEGAPVFHSATGWTEWSQLAEHDDKTLPQMPNGYLENVTYDNVFMPVSDAKDVIDADKMVSWHAQASRMDAGLQLTERLAQIAKNHKQSDKDRNLIVFIAASSLPYQNQSGGYQKLRPEAAKEAAKELKETYGATIFGFGDFNKLNLNNGPTEEEQRNSFNATMASICGSTDTTDGASYFKGLSQAHDIDEALSELLIQFDANVNPNAEKLPIDVNSFQEAGSEHISHTWAQIKAQHHILSSSSINEIASVDYYRFTGYDANNTPQFDMSAPVRHTYLNISQIGNGDSIQTTLNLVPIPPAGEGGSAYGEKAVITITDPVCVDYQWVGDWKPLFDPPKHEHAARNTTISPANPKQQEVSTENVKLKFDGWYRLWNDGVDQEEDGKKTWNYKDQKYISYQNTIYAAFGSDLQLYGRWVPFIDVNFHWIGSVIPEGLDKPSSVSLSLGDAGRCFYQAETPTLAGYEFDGWYKNSACTERYNSDGEKLSANTDLYGRWTKLGTKEVTFTVVNGSWNTESTWYKRLAASADGENTVTVQVPLRNGKGTLATDLIPYVDNGDMQPSDGHKKPGTWGELAPDTNVDAITENGTYQYTYTFPEANTYTITYRWMPGTEVPEDVSLPAQQSDNENSSGAKPEFSIQTVKSSDEKWHFDGWYTTSEIAETDKPFSSTEYSFEDTDEKNLTLYGKWSHEPCTVTFYADYDQPARGYFNDGSYSVSYTVPYGSKLTEEVPAPAPNSTATYYFEGWKDDYGNSNSDTFYTSRAIQTMTVKCDLNFVAQWWPIVTFNANGGAWKLSEGQPDIRYVRVPANADNHIDALRPPVKEGYTFLGWCYKDAGKIIDFNTETFNDARTVYARWAKNATVTFRIVNGYWSGGTAEDRNVTVVLYPQADGSVGGTLPASSVPAIMIPAAGYENAAGSWDAVPNIEPNGIVDSVTYTYTFGRTHSGGHTSGGSTSTKLTLHYESNGGTSYKDESYSSGTTVTLDKAPVRESYTFTGWYADKALTDKITNVKMTGNKTVYAGWTATNVPDMLNGDDHYAYVVGYSDGTVRPNANISRAEVATIFFRLLKAEVRDGNLTAENAFKDVTDGEWHNKAISTMAKLGVVKGRNAEAFDPDAPITRAEFATICARFDKTQISTSSNFTDISGHWAEKYIERAATLGWIAGYSDGTFRPGNYITRAEAMTMINRVLCRMPQSEDDLLNDMTVWPDNHPTDWHYLAVQEATNSHDFDRKGEVNEKWTKLTNGSDWRQYQ